MEDISPEKRESNQSSSAITIVRSNWPSCVDSEDLPDAIFPHNMCSVVGVVNIGKLSSIYCEQSTLE